MVTLVKTVQPPFVRKAKRKPVVSQAIKEKLWSRVLIRIILKHILRTSVLVVEDGFRVDHQYPLKSVRYSTFLRLRQLKLQNIDLKPWSVPIVDAKHLGIFLRMSLSRSNMDQE